MSEFVPKMTFRRDESLVGAREFVQTMTLPSIIDLLQLFPAGKLCYFYYYFMTCTWQVINTKGQQVPYKCNIAQRESLVMQTVTTSGSLPGFVTSLVGLLRTRNVKVLWDGIPSLIFLVLELPTIKFSYSPIITSRLANNC